MESGLFKCILALGLASIPVLPAPALAEEPAQAAPAPAPAPAELDPQALATAREVIRVGYPEEKRVAMFNAIMDSLLKQMRSVMMADISNDPGAKALVDAKIDSFVVTGKAVLAKHIPAFMESFAQGYAREFSASELTDILGFVKTPAGSHFLARSSAIISDPAFVSANRDYMLDLQAPMHQMQTELIDELKAYFTKHPPKPARKS